MTTLVAFHGWQFRVERERTRDAYEASSSRSAEKCSCAHCRNFVALRGAEYPAELRAFLDSVGIDLFKESEVYEVGPDGGGWTINAGWWHFIGEVESEGKDVISLSSEPGSLARDWSLLFLPGEASLKIETLPAAPLIQVEFSVTLPWVLDEPYPD